MLSIAHAALLFGAAAVAGGLNAVAGGGSFISFPALLFSGVAPVAANATNSVALWPGGLASFIAYRKDVREPRATLVTLAGASFVGGMVGAIVLLRTSDTTFVRLVPWLLLVATLVFTFGNTFAARVRARGADGPARGLRSVAIIQLGIAFYGGYFGGGVGIMMLAAFSLMGMADIHAMNGLKTLLSTFINGVAAIAFVVAGAVAWGPGLVMVVGGTAGGYAGAAVARKVNPRAVRRLVLVVAGP